MGTNLPGHDRGVRPDSEVLRERLEVESDRRETEGHLVDDGYLATPGVRHPQGLDSLFPVGSSWPVFIINRECLRKHTFPSV